MTQALWHLSPNHSALRQINRPSDPGLMRVRASFSMVSMGTERVVALGRVPEDAADTMGTPYMEGDFDFPVKYGYSLVGHDENERPVHCLHPHQDLAYVQPRDLVVLPTGKPLDRMVMASNLETAINATWDAELRPTDEAVVCGFGSVGALLAMTLRLMHGIEPVVFESDSYRRGIARDLGFETLGESGRYNDYRLMFNTSGSAAALQWCLDHASLEAKIVDLSWYGADPVSLRLGSRFHFNRVRLLSSQVSTVAAAKRNVMSRIERRQVAVDLLTDDEFDRLPRRYIAFSDTPRFFEELRAGTLPDGLIWLITYGD